MSDDLVHIDPNTGIVGELPIQFLASSTYFPVQSSSDVGTLDTAPAFEMYGEEQPYWHYVGTGVSLTITGAASALVIPPGSATTTYLDPYNTANASLPTSQTHPKLANLISGSLYANYWQPTIPGIYGITTKIGTSSSLTAGTLVQIGIVDSLGASGHGATSLYLDSNAPIKQYVHNDRIFVQPSDVTAGKGYAFSVYANNTFVINFWSITIVKFIMLNE